MKDKHKRYKEKKEKEVKVPPPPPKQPRPVVKVIKQVKEKKPQKPFPLGIRPVYVKEAKKELHSASEMHKVAEAVIDSLIPAIVQVREDGTAKITNSTQSESDGSSN